MSSVETALKEAMEIDGALGVALVDVDSGMALGMIGGGPVDLEIAAATNTEVVRAKGRAMNALGIHEQIEDILITLETQYHLIRLLQRRQGPDLFLYLVLDKSRANLAMARHRLRRAEADLVV
jgi:hypothetical protein